MTKRIAWMTAMLVGLLVAGCAAKEPSTGGGVPGATVAAGKVAEEAVTVTATVEAVDLKKRVVTLRGPEGKTFKVTADERVKNLPQVKKGDIVVATYYESLAYEVRKPGQGIQPGVVVAGDVATAKLGEKPGAVGAQAVTVTSTIAAIDKKNSTVTLKAPDGTLETIKVRDPSRLEPVAVGDLVEITYTEALAINVEAAK